MSSAFSEAAISTVSTYEVDDFDLDFSYGDDEEEDDDQMDTANYVGDVPFLASVALVIAVFEKNVSVVAFNTLVGLLQVRKLKIPYSISKCFVSVDMQDMKKLLNNTLPPIFSVLFFSISI